MHIDLMGLMRTKSPGGKRYIFVMVGDFSRYTLFRFLKEKYDTFQVFKSLCIMLQNEKEGNISKIIHLRSDHGKEFENSKFNEF